MKIIKYICDSCEREADTSSSIYNLDYGSAVEGNAIMGDNRVPRGGWLLCPSCFSYVVSQIVKAIKN